MMFLPPVPPSADSAPSGRAHQRQAGFLTTEAVLVIMVLVVLLPAVYAGWNMGFSALKSRAVAQQLVQVSDAAKAYARSHGLIATLAPGDSKSVSGADLIAEGFLPHSQGGIKNAWGHSYKAYFSIPPLPVPPPASGNTLSPALTVVVATVSATPDVVTREEAAKAAGFASGSAGYAQIDGSGKLVLRGVNGGWEIAVGSQALPTSAVPGDLNPVAGSIGTYVSLDDKALQNDLLYRVEVPGRPELNQMHVDLDMRDKSLKNVHDIRFNATRGTTASLADLCKSASGEPIDATDGKVFYYTDTDVSQSGLYACKGGKAFAVADSGNSVPVRTALVVNTGSTVPKPKCAAGTTPFITVAPAKVQSVTVPLPVGTSFYSSYTEISGGWKVLLTASTPAGVAVDVTGSTLSVMTSCTAGTP